MKVRGNIPGIDPAQRKVDSERVEKTTAKPRQAASELRPEKSRDAIQISPEGRVLQQAAERQAVEPARVQLGTDYLESQLNLPERLQNIRERLEKGFYQGQRVLDTVARRLLEDLGIPAPDSHRSEDDKP